MKFLLSTILFLSIISTTVSYAQEIGTMTDDRDGQTYATVKIDGSIWLAENLRFKSEESYSFEKNEENDKMYGRYYSYESALKSCPKGWKLPTENDYKKLADKYGGNYGSGKSLKSTKKWAWTTNGDNSSGFNIVPAGMKYKGRDSGQGEGATFWVAGDAPEGKGLIRTISSRDGNTSEAHYFKNESFTKANGSMTIRCIKE